ncbi:MAG: histidine kinase, partial [Mesorhizobium sp.]
MRRAAIEKAMADDRQHASGLVQLGQGQGQEQTFPGFLVFVRLNVETAPDVINASRSSTAGLLYAAFRARDLFQVALSKAPLLPVNVEIYDGKPGGDNLLFRSEAPPAESLGGRLVARRDIVVGGRPWTVL